MEVNGVNVLRISKHKCETCNFIKALKLIILLKLKYHLSCKLFLIIFWLFLVKDDTLSLQISCKTGYHLHRKGR